MTATMRLAKGPQKWHIVDPDLIAACWHAVDLRADPRLADGHATMTFDPERPELLRWGHGQRILLGDDNLCKRCATGLRRLLANRAQF